MTAGAEAALKRPEAGATRKPTRSRPQSAQTCRPRPGRQGLTVCPGRACDAVAAVSACSLASCITGSQEDVLSQRIEDALDAGTGRSRPPLCVKASGCAHRRLPADRVRRPPCVRAPMDPETRTATDGKTRGPRTAKAGAVTPDRPRSFPALQPLGGGRTDGVVRLATAGQTSQRLQRGVPPRELNA
jgi:hypothetical protein